jgi:xylulose-5-phosphate/fructose-6-phosphate phosphoketolase
LLTGNQGWTGPKEVDGKIIEGSFHSHQVPLPKANSSDSQLKALGDWLSSYKISELIQDGKPVDTVLSVLPEADDKKLGQVKTTYAPYSGLKSVDWSEFSVEKGTAQSCMQVTGKYLDKVFQENPTSIRLFSPDELESNKLDAVLQHTQRNFQWDQFSRANGGRVIEVLSEHDCQGFMQGYTLTGRTALFPSYESFLGIIHTMMVQYSKFVKIAREVKWRGDLPSINYIETSTWARQEHNGFSHQNPSFIGAVLNLKAEAARVRQAKRTNQSIPQESFLSNSPLGLPTTRRELLPQHGRSHPALQEQDQPGHRLQTTHAGLPLGRRSRRSLPGRRFHLALRLVP